MYNKAHYVGLILILHLLTGCATASIPNQYKISEVPIYTQGSMECGPTSLRMVLNFYGQNLKQSDLNIASQTWGTPSYKIEHYARKYGFKVSSFNWMQIVKIKSLLSQGYPLLIGGTIPKNWPCSLEERTGHWIVVHGYDEDNFSIVDPSCGKAFEISHETTSEFLIKDKFRTKCIIQIYPKVK